MPLAERIDRRCEYELNTGCFLWSGARSSKGYGLICIEKKTFLAHRVSYEAHKGAIPAGLILMHKCDTPLCVNPEHLTLGTFKDNSADMVAKGRGRRPSKFKHVSPAEAQAIRAAEGRITDISRLFGRDIKTIRRIQARAE